MQYCIARGADLGPIGEKFGTACDQIDRADAMLAARHQRARHSRSQPEQARAETSEPQITALAHPDPETQTVTLILDAATANTVMFAVAANADEREAHIREVEQLGQRFPEGSFGRATARPSPPARRGSPPACGPSNVPTGRQANAMRCSVRPRHSG